MDSLELIVKSYVDNTIGFDEVLDRVGSLEWAEKTVDPSGEVSWDGINSFTIVDNFVYDGSLTLDEREQIVKRVLPQ